MSSQIDNFDQLYRFFNQPISFEENIHIQLQESFQFVVEKKWRWHKLEGYNIDAAIKLMKEVKPGIVVDVACGNGVWAATIAQYCGKLYAVDMCSDALSVINNGLKANKITNAKPIAGIAEHLPILSDSIDLVYTNAFIEHTYNPYNVFKEIYRILKPGGIYHLSAYANNLNLSQGHLFARPFDEIDIVLYHAKFDARMDIYDYHHANWTCHKPA